MPYFYNFPKINYFNKEARNIILKAAIIKQVVSSVDAFFPHIIKEFERPDIIAYGYYNDENLDWLVYFSNEITDPYYDWPLFGDDFDKYIMKKYNMSIYETMSTIDHYEYTGITGESDNDIARQSWQMSVDTHGQKVAFGEDTSGWSPVYIYDYEQRLNEAKRSIRLLNRIFVPQIEKELKQIFNA